MRNACWVVIVSCLLVGPGRRPRYFRGQRRRRRQEQRPARAEPWRHGQPRADDRQGPAAGPRGRPHRAGQLRPAVSRVRLPGRHPAQRRGAPDAVHLRRQRGHAGRLRADSRGRLDPFPRQYLPLPPQDVDPARLVSRRPFHPAAAAAPGDRLPAASWNRCNGARSKGPSTSPSRPAGCRPTTS